MHAVARSTSPWPVEGGEMGERIRALDWARTPLGPIGQWPQSLKSTVDLMLGSPLPMGLLWGPALIRLYNDAYRDLIGDKHPAGLGQSAAEVWPELAEFTEPIYATVLGGEARSLRDQKLRLDRYGAPEDGWFDLTYSPVRDEAGAVAGILLTSFEVTEKVRGEARLREREQRETMVLEAVSDAVVALDADWRITLLNRAGEEYFGIARDEVIGRSMTDAFPETKGSIYEDCFARAMRTGEALTFVAPSVAMPERTIEMRVSPMAGGVVVSFSDVTQRKRAEDALRAAEERYRLAARATNDVVWDLNPITDRIHWAEAAQESFGYARLDMGTTMQWWEDAIHPDDRERVSTGIQAALDGGESWADEYRLRRADGSYADVLDRGTVLRDERGRAVRMIGAIVDQSDRKRAEETQKLLIAELEHRTRNLLAIVRSIARQTKRASTSLDEFSNRFDQRLSALSRVQALLSRDSGQGVQLRELVEEELTAHGASIDNGRVRVTGPAVALTSKAVQVLTLALHELATNAVKHGALLQEGAMLSIAWTVSGAPEHRLVTVDWMETGVRLPGGRSPTHRGFGRHLIEAALPYDLGGETCWSLEPDGVRCRLRVPIDGGNAEAGADGAGSVVRLASAAR
jgi:PAS domain S-box-containing protein